ncbi:uncharacterized [Tachysurus ichikawai]
MEVMRGVTRQDGDGQIDQRGGKTLQISAHRPMHFCSVSDTIYRQINRKVVCEFLQRNNEPYDTSEAEPERVMALTCALSPLQ